MAASRPSARKIDAVAVILTATIVALYAGDFALHGWSLWPRLLVLIVLAPHGYGFALQRAGQLDFFKRTMSDPAEVECRMRVYDRAGRLTGLVIVLAYECGGLLLLRVSPSTYPWLVMVAKWR
ncbi:MAG TPA: hypothetical protein VIK27_08050 [Candidatus Aquilonibacter sp.]